MGMPSAHSTPSTAIASASLAVGGMPKSSLVVTGLSEAAAIAFRSASFNAPPPARMTSSTADVFSGWAMHEAIASMTDAARSCGEVRPHCEATQETSSSDVPSDRLDFACFPRRFASSCATGG